MAKTETREVAIASEDDQGMAGQVSQHFGRCPFYTVVKVQGEQVLETRVEPNPFYGNHQPGQMPNFIHQLGANVILAGGMGPRAIDLFGQLGIEVATGAIGQVDKVLAAYLRSEIQGTAPCNHDHPESCGGH